MEAEDARSALHRQAWHLIPWVVNGTASRADQALVLDHVATCPDCREELALQRRVQAAVDSDDRPLHAPGPALARLWDRIDDEDAMAQSPAVQAPTPGFRWTRWLVAAVVVQAVGLTALIGLQWQERPAPGYATLSQAPTPPSAAVIRLVPSPTLRLEQLQALLKSAGVRIVESNADGSILGLAPARSDDHLALDEAVTRLRADAGVLLAEPILGGASSTKTAPPALP